MLKIPTKSEELISVVSQWQTAHKQPQLWQYSMGASVNGHLRKEHTQPAKQIYAQNVSRNKKY